MIDVIKVRLWDRDLGALSWDESRNFGSFEFFPDFLETGWNVSPIHMELKASRGKIYSFPSLNQETYRGLPGMLSDVLPDDFGNRLIDRWLALNNIRPLDFTPLDRLTYIGSRGMGGLEFVPARELGYEQSTSLNIGSLVELSGKVLQEREALHLNLQETETLNELIKVGTSAGGQRAKAIIAYNPDTGEIRSGQTMTPEGFQYYILKFDGVTNEELGDPQGYGRIEYAYYLMAIACGIEMMPSRLLEENGRAHFMTQRFDRLEQGKKLHMQTLCSLAHFDYKKPGVYGYEDAFQVMRQLRLPFQEAVQLYRRMVFNVVARNQDDHTKNISFTMDPGGRWQLSPAYDVTYAYNPSGIWTNSHQLTIQGKVDRFTRNDLLAVAKSVSLKDGAEILDEVLQTVRNWSSFAEQAGVPEKQANRLVRAFRFYL